MYGFDTEFVGYELPRAGVVPAELMQARQMVGLHLKPAAGGLIKQELARLRVSTKVRSESADDLVMGFQVFAEECSEYPADVVVWALRGWARSEVFYPSLAEIRDRLQRGARRRKALLAVLARERPDDRNEREELRQRILREEADEERVSAMIALGETP